MPSYRANRQARYKLWDKWGMLPFEAREFSKQYSIKNMRELPYLIRMGRARRLYGTNLASKGYGADEIARSILMLYRQKGWLTPDGRPDAWQMLKSYRRLVINAGGDPSPGFAPKRSHHSRKEITQQELRAQARQIELQRKINQDVFGR